MSHEMAAAPIPPGQIEHGGKRFMVCADGQWIPVERVKASDKLQDDFVREKIARAEEISAALAQFRSSSLEDGDILLDVLASQYRVVLGGKKGNVIFETLDGTMRVQIAVAARITLGPQLQIAKAGIDELLLEWGEKSPAEMVAIVSSAFRANKAGDLSAGRLLGLRRIDIPDERWVRAMQAINDSVKVVGSKRYVRFHKRASADDAWVAIPTSLADV